MLDKLTVTLRDPERQADILSDWTWLIGSAKRPLLLTAAGDAFVQDLGDGSVHYLNVNAGQVSRIAETTQAFEHLLHDAVFVDAYLCPHLVDDLRRRGMVLKQNEIYSYRIPLALGGKVGADNIDIANAEVHFSIAGQIARQIVDLPAGTPIRKIDVGMPRVKPWWKFW
jgi:hypothetical protein